MNCFVPRAGRALVSCAYGSLQNRIRLNHKNSGRTRRHQWRRYRESAIDTKATNNSFITWASGWPWLRGQDPRRPAEETDGHAMICKECKMLKLTQPIGHPTSCSTLSTYLRASAGKSSKYLQVRTNMSVQPKHGTCMHYLRGLTSRQRYLSSNRAAFRIQPRPAPGFRDWRDMMTGALQRGKAH